MNPDPFSSEYRVRVRGAEDVYRNPKTGAVWREEPIDGNPDHVMCTYIDSPMGCGASITPTLPVAAAGLDRIPTVTVSNSKLSMPSKPKPPEPIRRQTGNSGIGVHLHADVLLEICRACIWQNIGQEFREAGGWLQGTWDGNAVQITGATTRATKRTPTSVQFDLADAHALDLKQKWGLEPGMVGSWHLQPPASFKASTQDFVAAERQWEYLNEVHGSWEPYVVSIIVSSEDGSLTNLSAATWTTAKRDGQYISEPAKLRVV